MDMEATEAGHMDDRKCRFKYYGNKWDCPVCKSKDTVYIDSDYDDGNAFDGSDIKYYYMGCATCDIKFRLIAMEVFIGSQIENIDYKEED